MKVICIKKEVRTVQMEETEEQQSCVPESCLLEWSAFHFTNTSRVRAQCWVREAGEINGGSHLRGSLYAMLMN